MSELQGKYKSLALMSPTLRPAPGRQELTVSAEENQLFHLFLSLPPVRISQELLSINWLFVPSQTMQICYTPAVFCCYWGKKCLQPPLFCSTSPKEVFYDVLIKKLTGAMHNLLSSLRRWALGGQLGVRQCLPSQMMTKMRVAVGLAEGEPDTSTQMCNSWPLHQNLL